ncbi:hypothetical protein GW17_00001242 [Ensete ventricosum]|nr:hypothetical protein GW17_00001242 [Ensete ventricosum]
MRPVCRTHDSRVEQNGRTDKSTDARALTTERRFQPESKILITTHVGEFTYSTETRRASKLCLPRKIDNKGVGFQHLKSSPCIDRGLDGAVGNSPGVRRELTGSIGSLPRWRKGVHRKKTKTRRTIVRCSRKVCRELERS